MKRRGAIKKERENAEGDGDGELVRHTRPSPEDVEAAASPFNEVKEDCHKVDRHDCPKRRLSLKYIQLSNADIKEAFRKILTKPKEGEENA